MWNHNNHYHKFILSKIPKKRIRALDIGSGEGSFGVKLSKFFKSVSCLEPDPIAYNYAIKNLSTIKNLTHINSNLKDFNPNEKFDFITFIASIHHMDFVESLEKSISLLSDNGVLVILGLYRESNILDYIYTIAAIIPNIIKSKKYKTNIETSGVPIKTKPAQLTFSDVKRLCNENLRNFKIKRHLYWRYSIVYRR